MGRNQYDAGPIEGEENFGHWENDAGHDVYGVERTGAVEIWEGHNGNRRYGAKGPSYDGGANISEDGAEFGGTVNALSADWTYDEQDPDSASDSELHLGGSLGWGAGGRVHSTDDDKDGVKEYGFGFDWGPVSFDYKSEDIAGDALNLAGPVGRHINGLRHQKVDGVAMENDDTRAQKAFWKSIIAQRKALAAVNAHYAD